MGTFFGFTVKTKDGEFTLDGYPSLIEAQTKCYRWAIEAGSYKPATLRQAWWQFWRPREWPDGVSEALSEIEQATDQDREDEG